MSNELVPNDLPNPIDPKTLSLAEQAAIRLSNLADADTSEHLLSINAQISNQKNELENSKSRDLGYSLEEITAIAETIMAASGSEANGKLYSAEIQTLLREQAEFAVIRSRRNQRLKAAIAQPIRRSLYNSDYKFTEDKSLSNLPIEVLQQYPQQLNFTDISPQAKRFSNPLIHAYGMILAGQSIIDGLEISSIGYLNQTIYEPLGDACVRFPDFLQQFRELTLDNSRSVGLLGGFYPMGRFSSEAETQRNYYQKIVNHLYRVVNSELGLDIDVLLGPNTSKKNFYSYTKACYLTPERRVLIERPYGDNNQFDEPFKASTLDKMLVKWKPWYLKIFYI